MDDPSRNAMPVLAPQNKSISFAATSPSSYLGSENQLVSDRASYLVDIIFAVALSGFFGVAGVVANTLNALVFFKQGLKESATISLFCLSLSDWLICMWTFMAAVSQGLANLYPSGPVDFFAFYLAVVGIPMACFSQLSMVTTMMLCLERCLCIVRPLTVNEILTRGRTLCILLLLFVEIIVFNFVFMLQFRLTWQFDDYTNMTRLQFHALPLNEPIGDVLHIVNGQILTIFCVCVVIISTVAMVWGIQKATKFRKRHTKPDQREIDSDASTTKVAQSGLSKKDIRLVQVVIYIAILFIFAYLPGLFVVFVETFIEPDLRSDGKFQNVNEVMWAVINMLGGLNAAGNIVIYYLLSERYKTIFVKLLCSKGD